MKCYLCGQKSNHIAIQCRNFKNITGNLRSSSKSSNTALQIHNYYEPRPTKNNYQNEEEIYDYSLKI